MSTFSVDDRYDCSVPTLHATVTNADYLQVKFPAIGFRDVVVVAADPTRVQTGRTVSAPLPGFARRVLGETQTVTQVEDWTATPERAEGTFTAHATGTPIRITGTMLIEPAVDGPDQANGLPPASNEPSAARGADATGGAHGAGCVLRIRGDVVAKVPLSGGKIADLVAAEAGKTLAREYAFTQRWLADHP